MLKLLIITITLALPLTSFSKERLIITGSSTIAPVMNDLAKAYENMNKGIRIDVQTGGSSRGIADIRNGISNIGMVSRALKAKESDLEGHTIALDGLAIIVHKSNKITQLSPEQIKSIYLGKISNWKELGGQDKKIVVINKAEGRSTLELFLKFFKLKNSQIKPDIIIGDNEQGIKSVKTNPLAIAYVSIGTAQYNASVGVPIKSLDFKGVKAKVKNIKNGTYPLLRQLILITNGTKSPLVIKFIDYVKSTKANAIIKEHFFVPNN